MLEKMFGCALITKLWSILLMEADFNATNKIIYGQRMLHQARKYQLIPEEIYSKWNRLADDGTLTKVLFYNIVCQTWLPTGISAVDADNCYDRIAHPIVLLVFQALGVPQEAVVSFLSTIQDMKIFLQQVLGTPRCTRDQPMARKCKGYVKEMEQHQRVGPSLGLQCSKRIRGKAMAYTCPARSPRCQSTLRGLYLSMTPTWSTLT